jgi:GH15 family glucan-1,4-alpha-glucosidase
MKPPKSAEEFLPVRSVDGYAPIENHGLIGDGSAAALVSADGSIPWLCAPRFDDAPVFAKILDSRHGGTLNTSFDGVRESRQWYEPDTAILHTELRSPSGLVRLTDAMTLQPGADLSEDVHAGRGELVRSVRVLDGPVRLRVDVQPRALWRLEMTDSRISFRDGPAELHLSATVPLGGQQTVLELEQGDVVGLVLRWESPLDPGQPSNIMERLDVTAEGWRRWMRKVEYEGSNEGLVRRAAVTLKLLDHFEGGAMIAAPTSSLPEAIGGSRNWDYRFSWIRDAAFSVYAMRRIGLRTEAWGFLAWVLAAVERQGRPRALFNLDGEVPMPEYEDPELEGYRRSRPVRWGNAAAYQAQHDAYGEILDCAYQWGAGGAEIGSALWANLSSLVEEAGRLWRTPDHGIWEVRTEPRPFTYSAAMCQVALDRGVRLAERFGLSGDLERWRAEAERIRRAIIEEAWSAELDSLTEHLGGGGLDASLLALPLRRVISADHPRMVATTRAVANRLSAGEGLLYRYLPEESPDGLPGAEGAFLMCSFWLVDNLAAQGRLEAAVELFERSCGRANPLGLLPEQIDPSTGAFLGNFPQAFSHVGLISSGMNLARRIKRLARQDSSG